MKYDFDTVVDRSGTNSVKWEWEKNEGHLPMWVADMDFAIAPEIHEAIKKRAEHPVFGYTQVPEEWNNAYKNWWKKNHGLESRGEWFVFATGVIPIISTAIKRFTAPGDYVLIQAPVYNHFYISIKSTGRVPYENELLYEAGEYFIDWTDLEEKLAHPKTTLMIICNPQNPSGKIWSKKDLERMGELAAANGVVVLSDEIHCDITDPDKSYTPFASVSDICRDISITAMAPTKTFNIAGLLSAAAMIPNRHLRKRMKAAMEADEVVSANAFAVDATIAAFTKGGPWLKALKEYVYKNKTFVKKYLDKNLPDVDLVPGEATYLLWLDVSEYGEDSSKIYTHIKNETGLVLCEGKIYGESGRHFLRMNIGAPKALVEEGMNRLKKGLESYREKNEHR